MKILWCTFFATCIFFGNLLAQNVRKYKRNAIGFESSKEGLKLVRQVSNHVSNHSTTSYLGGGFHNICDMFNYIRAQPNRQIASYADGKWQRNRAAAFKLSSRFDGYSFAGYDLSITGPFGSVPPASWDRGGRSLLCFGPDVGNEIVQQRLDSLLWRWKPSTCTLRPFDSVYFKELLQNLNVVLVGDSMMDQLRSSIWALTGHLPPFFLSWNLVNIQTLQVLSPAQGQYCMCITEANNATNTEVECPSSVKPDKCPKPEEKGPYWASYALMNTNVLVLNTGAHLSSFIKTFDMARIVARNIASYLLKHFSGSLLVWMKTPLYREGCENHLKPLDYIPSATKKWEWDKIEIYDKILVEELQQMAKLSHHFTFVVMDTSMTNMRLDQHPPGGVDCLHFCYPGGMDVWSHLLFNILAQKADGLSRDK